MADFLASFGVSTDTSAKPSKKKQCASADELADKLQTILDENTNETRADHVTSNLKLSSSAQFDLSLTESENDALEGLNNVDPSLGGVRSATLSADPAGGTTTRLVQASDTIMNQSDNPVLQRAVAKHVIGALSSRDHSTWVLRDLSRGSSGWIFSYICKASLQHWTRQNAKNPTTAVIGDCTLRVPDPVLMSRPAFDCRGSITITFNRKDRCISVRYDHTLLHKTVEELSKAYPTPERVFGPGYERQQQQKLQAREQKKKLKQKTPREPKGEGEGKEKRRKKKRDAPADGEAGADGERPKKRHKKRKKSAEETATGTAGEAVMPPDYPGARLPNEQGEQNWGSYAQASQATLPAPATGSLPFNISPEEAARRLAIARKLLSDHGVNPDSLSVDQMNIFSNQSPALQQDSVQMLAKYGAERLQIIHPSNKDKPSSEGTTERAQQATPSGPTTSKELAPDAKPTKSGRKSKPTPKAANGDQTTVHGSNETPSKSHRKLGKSRLSCLCCKTRRVKCPKERPSCSECQSEGQPCEYPPQKPRSRKSGPVITIEEDEDEDEDEDDEEEEEEGVIETTIAEHAGIDGSRQQGDAAHATVAAGDASSYNQMPVADMLTPSVDPPHGHDQEGYLDAGAHLNMAQSAYPALPDSSLNTTSDTVMASAKTVSPGKGRHRLKTSAGSPSQQSLPQGSGGHGTAAVGSGSSWMAGNNVATANSSSSSNNKNHNNTTMSPILAQQAMLGQQQARQSSPLMSTNSPQLRDNAAQPAHHNNTTPTQAQQSPQMMAAMQTQARRSPFQAQQQQRAMSQHGQRAHTRTPNADALSRAYPPHAPTQPIQQAAPPPNNDLVASSAYNDYGRYAGNNAAANDASHRIAYEPYSQQERTTAAPTSTSYPAFDMSRGGSTTMSMNAAATTMASTHNSQESTAGPWSGSSRSSQPHDRASGFGSSGSYGQPTTDSALLSNFDMRANSQNRGRAGYATQTQPVGSQGPWSYFGGPENNSGSNGSGWV
ncbi:uncharacterized protein J7T54_002310 [Emericellopsis cladophorae]|uniref:Zn(2)-C6 fungal-type domain-containing protein n=1 Tax=Emericellopsis cladophorae TaxID=2686198 RepID=A0A9Q0BDI4_9HYPO|nr:uncharacterized protein J7T54_002310 [Emericellopsis cladophorae]KAI6781417.1 hypothetical protein J7T54_002310 [Emericellopsis cladophorae]